MIEEEVHSAANAPAGLGRDFVGKSEGSRDIGLGQRWVFLKDRGIGIAGVVELLDHADGNAGSAEDRGMVRDVAMAFQDACRVVLSTPAPVRTAAASIGLGVQNSWV